MIELIFIRQYKIHRRHNNVYLPLNTNYIVFPYIFIYDKQVDNEFNKKNSYLFHEERK